MKNTIKYILQRLLGFRRYLYVFSKYKIRTLKFDKKEKDFFLFTELLKDGEGDILDIGANIGIMTYHLASKFPTSSVIAFEPMPDNLIVFNQIIEHYSLKNVEVKPIALSDSPGKVSMILPNNGKTKMQGLSHVKHDSITEWNEGEEFEVVSNTLDSELAGHKIQGIKIDIENFEYFAFKGGEALLKEHLPVIYAELWDNENRKLCFDLLSSIGYKVYVAIDNQLVEFDHTKHQKQNFIFKSN